jgi:hypothetical protein
VNILTVNLLFSTLVFWVAARLHLLPKLAEYEPRAILLPILLLHSTRHLGLMFQRPAPSTWAFHNNSRIRQPSAICWRPRWPSSQFRQLLRKPELQGLSFGSLTLQARWIC